MRVSSVFGFRRQVLNVALRAAAAAAAAALLLVTTAPSAQAGISGACCYSIDSCQTTSPSYCDTELSGTYQGDGTMCSTPGICGAPVTTTTMPPVCGNAVLEVGEQCDDGNTAAGDGCSPTCQYEICGNNTVDAGEQCDDGNTASGDGCSPTCQYEVCGNSTLDPGEQCDDGNTAAGDGCSPSCQNEYCGDGVISCFTPRGRTFQICEQCDDGNTATGDGCGATCRFEVCGNFIVDPGEACDDGNSINGDDCDNNCTLPGCGNGAVDPGEMCDDGNTATGDGCGATCQTEVCGNGILDPTEACDDGNTVNGDGCDNNCTLTACGNNIVTCPIGVVGGRGVSCEQCDDGNTAAGDGCGATCLTEVCGNGILDPGEACDDGNTNNGDGCDNNCTVTACGNGIVTCPLAPVSNRNVLCARGPGGCGCETCDDSNTVAGDGCSDTCQTEFCGDSVVNNNGTEQCDDGNTDNTDACVGCQNAFCGDGQVEAKVEACDDGNTNNFDACSNLCVSATCGDGVVNISNGKTLEQCDDGNTNDVDGCSNLCVSAICGDGIINVSNGKTLETCDDGNTADGDGCSATCTLEVGACCHGALCDDNLTSNDCGTLYKGSFTGNGTTCNDPGICVNCGDGNLQFGEECDDGGTVAADGCSATCAVEDCWECQLSKGFPASNCETNDNLPCADTDVCTLADHCHSGHCVGSPPVIPAACYWVAVDGAANGKGQVRARSNTLITGDLCGQVTRIGLASAILGDVVATSVTGHKISTFSPAAQVVGDIITGGASITGLPNGVLLPGLSQSVVGAGTSAVQTGDATRDLDATGTSALSIQRVGDCQTALNGLVPATTFLDGMLATAAPFGKVSVPNNGSMTIDATTTVNVIDFERLLTGNAAKLTLDGHSIPDVVFILRVTKKMYLKLSTELILANGAAPERVIILGRNVCKIGQMVTGGGTLYCPYKKMKVDQNTKWDGALIGGSKRIDIRHQVTLTHVPLLVGGAP